jgi:hypothetical protein
MSPVWVNDDKGWDFMGSRRFVVVGAVAALALLTGVSSANAAPSGSDGHGVGVDAHLKQARSAADDPILSEFVPVNPFRVLDTRNGRGAVGPNGTTVVDLSAQLPSNATAAVLNVTGTEPTASTFISVYPASGTRSIASSLNLSPGQTRANQVTVAVNADRGVAFYNLNGSTHVVADLAGYYVDGTASRYTARQPQRIVDTRNGGGPVQGGTGISLNLSFLPASATAVTFNLTGLNASQPTVVTAFPNGQSVPLVSNLNLGRNEIVPNQVTVQIGANRQVVVYNSFGTVDLIVDVVGFYATDQGDYFAPISPERAMDTRPGAGLDGVPGSFIGLYGWGETTGSGTISAVAGNLTATNPNYPQFVVVWPGGQARPTASNLNLVAGQTAANAVNAGIGYEPQIEGGKRTINFANNAGYVDVIFDISGFFVTP